VDAPHRRRKTLALGIAGGIAAIAVVAVIRWSPGGRPGSTVARDAGADAAATAPAPAAVAPIARAGTGTERLAGSIVDASGAPIGDVAIVATLELGPGDPAGDPGGGAAQAEIVAYAGADGEFLLEGLEPGRHRLRVEGAAIFTAELRSVPVPSDGLRIAVARRVAIAGSVVDGGVPVPGARVTIDAEAIGGRLEVITAADGGFAFDELPEGSYRVWAHDGDLAARAIAVPRLGGGPFPDVTLILEPATIVVGRVIDRVTGAGVAAAVALEPVDDSAGVVAEAPRFARTDADGVFRIEGVPHGRWLADAWAPGWLSSGGLEIAAGRGVPRIEVYAGGVIAGRVVDGRGRPVGGAAVVALGHGAADRRVLEASGGVDADRLRRFSGFAPVGRTPPPGAARAGSSADFTADPSFVPRGELGVLLGPIPFPPPRGASIVRQTRIVPVDPAAPGVASAGPPPLAADAASAPRFDTDADGRFRITGLAAATWTVVASAPAMADGRSAPIAIEAGKVTDDVEVVVGPGTFVAGTVTSDRAGPLVGATIAATPRGATGDRGRVVGVTGADGRYRIGPLVGDVVVTAAAWGHAEVAAEVSLAAPAGDVAAEVTHDFVLERADAVLRGRVVDPDRLPVRGAQLVVTHGAARGRRARSDDTGWFEIKAVPAGEATVEVAHPEFPAQRATIDTAGDATVALAWGGGLAGVVVDRATGGPVAGITIAIDGPGGRRDVATGARGEVAAGPLLAGRYQLRIAVPGYVAVDHAVEVEAGRGAGAVTARDVRIELERGALLAGVVRDRRGARLAGAEVTVGRDGGPSVRGRTDGEGEFRLRDVPTGDVVVRVDKGAHRGSKPTTLRPGDEILTFQIATE
jgi:hypothetical protein